MSAPRAPKKAPISIIPSRPMFTTPLRSENMPPIAAKVSGVAHRSVAVASAPQKTTMWRCVTLDCVARIPPAIPRSPATMAPQPTRRSCREAAQIPVATLTIPTATGTTMLRA